MSKAAVLQVEPDPRFIRSVIASGGGDLEKCCLECGVCTAACDLAPEEAPFPRAQMIYAQWGLKEKALGGPAIWLCHNCGDCTAQCPKGARPGDVLAALRREAIKAYAFPQFMGKLVLSPPGLLALLALPVLIFAAIARWAPRGSATPQLEFANVFPIPTLEALFFTLAGCVAGVDVRDWVNTLAQAEAYGRSNEQAFEMAWRKITDRNPFPAICGRVCPHPCEDHCNRVAKDGAVAVNALERFVGDFAIQKRLKLTRLSDETFPERVAVVGAGPAGLSCAYQLARRGYGVTVFEAFSRPGGMLRYGIPRYRLPGEVLDAEIGNVLELGVELKCNCIVGNDVTLQQLRDEHRAVFVGIGAQEGVKLRVPGENATNVFTGTAFLNRVNSGEKVEIGNRVIVVGGGDTAIDAARVSKRLGAEVTIVYRRTRAEMPAIKPEIEGALEEGVKIEFLAAPVEILQEDGLAVGMRCIRMELGAPDSSGRPRPVPKPGTEFAIEASAIIPAISQEPNVNGFGDLNPTKGWLQGDAWGATGTAGVFAGGDDVELGLVGIAIAQGRFAAEAIDAYLRGKKLEKPNLPPLIAPEKINLGWYPAAARHERPQVPVEERGPETEVQLGLSEADALAEAKRCLSCGMCMDCETCWMYCTNNCFVRMPKGQHYKIRLEICNGCKKCAEACPCGYIELI